jgi:tRNA G18 (ribose-2'-O)-methylase SpoU
MNRSVTLVGDGIENPANALTMVHAAGMFGAACRFRDTKGLLQSPTLAAGEGSGLATLSPDEIRTLHRRRIAFDNLPGAQDVYGFPCGSDLAVLVGNERRGLSHECIALATDRVQVPMQSRQINCLNVAAASAVALYYLCGRPVGPMATRRDPSARRPELLLMGAGDHIELGSAIRSATAFGWDRAFVEDRQGVWFGCDRVVRSEGRAAARRGRNEIRLVACVPNVAYGYPSVTVITCQPVGVPLRRSNLARGPRHLVAIPDESRVSLSAEGWGRLGQEVEFAHLELPNREFWYHYRLVATVALAEISRQVGRLAADQRLPGPRPPIYDLRLGRLAEAAGETVRLEDLVEY